MSDGMKYVFIVTSGTHDEKTMVAVFSTRQQASDHARNLSKRIDDLCLVYGAVVDSDTVGEIENWYSGEARWSYDGRRTTAVVTPTSSSP